MSSKLESTYLFKPDIIVVTEIYPKHSLYKTAISELSIDCYNVFCNNISSAHHNTYIKSCLNVYLDILCLTKFSESVWCNFL